MKRPNGLTLVEVLVVIGVIVVLVGILVPAVSYAREKSRVLKCASNLNQIAVAAELYYNDYHAPPMGNLRTALADYVDSPDVFVCPNDRGATDSYSEFYVARSEPGSSQFVVGCPRHGKGNRGAVAFGKGDCDDVVVAPVTHDGQPVEPGEVVTGGKLTFSDGSTVEISESGQVGLLMSFADDGVCHSVIFVPKDSATQLRCQVTPGSRFEVVTPASIAGVEGTKFDVQTGWECDPLGTVQYFTIVKVHEGKVRVTDRVGGGKGKVVPPGLSDKTKVNGRWAANDPAKGNKSGKGTSNGGGHKGRGHGRDGDKDD